MASPGIPRWLPSAEAEMQAAMDDGTLREGHYLDMKASVGDTDSARKETARDLASFSLHGGALIVGVGELKGDQGWKLEPQPLAGLAEKVEQIATSRIDPPLYVVCTDIPSTQDSAKGYLIVEVPPSPLAPHMTDGRYYGRGDRTRTTLSDADVMRLHQVRQVAELQVFRFLDEELARDPAGSYRRTGRIYGVAQPTAAPSHLARSLVRAQTTSDAATLIMGVDAHVPEPLRNAYPALTGLSNWHRRSQGRAWSSGAINAPGRKVVAESISRHDRAQEGLLDVELREDGGVRLLVGRLLAKPSGGGWVIMDGLAVAYTVRLVLWARAMAEATGYRGGWDLGLACVDIRGRAANDEGNAMQMPSYDADEYREVTSATYRELSDQPGAVVERLVGRFTWVLNTDRRYVSLYEALNAQARPSED